ncbi:isopentenyl-diphosphate Delta-isomerase [Paenarthrobacter sp. PH39-S1]|uniref:isopentenyl-diphosphate Delta-isomerase n=1 Tax=Micrococcaceae TaxID=1268 RepID=UPI0024BAAB19|nr:isopentenyl-diphosphate Delta-isomerase [Paenarthrobacter sp. PH39-S1]MDJ0355916.1 isopentenyl-diphosphate Delta-isomerase [Paenarthrobacter sp. PH39-S1]
MNTPVEHVRLMDHEGREIGTADKRTVHSRNTPLHLAFSCHVFDTHGRTLVTRRALSKLTWPGVWTNAFCGHPAPGESFENAIGRRAAEELRIELTAPTLVLPEFRYRAVDASGIVENEICPVFSAIYWDGPTLDPNSLEVCDWAWVKLQDLRRSAAATPFAFSPWLVLQLQDGVALSSTN